MPIDIEKSFEKLRALIFHRFTPEDYGIVRDSEIVVPGDLNPQGVANKPTIGRLEYRLTGIKDADRVSIAHDGGDRFTIHTSRKEGEGPHERWFTQSAIVTSLQDLDSVLMHSLKPRWGPDGKPWFR